MSRALVCLLSAVLLTVSTGPTIARASDDPGLELPVADLVEQASRKLAEGDPAGARADLVAAIERLTGAGRTGELVGALASLATLDAEGGRPRQALDSWLRALPSADALAHGESSENPDIGVFVRVQIAELLLSAGDAAGSEAMGWAAVGEAVDLDRPEAAPVGVLAVLRVAAVEGDLGVRERAVELDELLAPLEGYRLHPLPRPLPLGFMAHDVARQYAEAGLFAKAEPAFATAARTYAALGADDLAARATVDLARAAMERGRLDEAAAALTLAGELDPAVSVDAGAPAVEAELLLRGGRPAEAGERFLALAEATDAAERRVLYLGRAARLLALGDPVVGAELHRRTADGLEALGALPEATAERTLRAAQLARAGQWRTVGEVLGRIDGALGTEGAPPLPAEVAARLALARADWHQSRGEASLVRAALEEAGGALFRQGRTDGVAAVAARYVDLALHDGDLDAADLAVENTRQIEESLGLRVDGWRALAAEARVAAARGDLDAASAAYREAAARVEWLAFAREVPREPPVVGDPAEGLYAPWMQLLLASARHGEAFEVLQRWRRWDGGGPVADGDTLALQEQVRALRDTLRTVSTRATREDPAALRAPLLDELARLRDVMPAAPVCTADQVRARLDGGGLLDGVVLPGGRWAFLVTPGGLEVSGLPASGELPRKAPLRRGAASVSRLAQAGLPGWGRPGAIERRVEGACAVLDTWTEPLGSAMAMSAVPPRVPAPLDAALGAAVEPAPLPAGAVVVSPAPVHARQVAALRARGAGAVVVADLDAARLTDLLRAGKGLDPAVRALSARRGPPPEIWGPLP